MKRLMILLLILLCILLYVPKHSYLMSMDTESCAICHDSGAQADVEEVHRLVDNTIAGTITDVDIDTTAHTTTVSFTITDDGVGEEGFDSGSIRFTIARLEPASGGDSSEWQSYITQEETMDEDAPGTTDVGTTVTQATYEKASATGGVFTDLGNGDYTYQFATDIDGSTLFEADKTHRVAMQISGNITNGIYDFVPDGSIVIDTREIVKTASCNECHYKLALHGSGRVETKYCVTCHNPGSADANSGNTVDFTVMIHKIHRGEGLPGGEYTIWGYRDAEHDYSDVAYPQDIRYCTKCHDGDDDDTEDGYNWKNVPTMAACGSCHDDISFETTENIPEGMTQHSGGDYSSNAVCVVCHRDTGGIAGIVDVHEISARIAAADFQYNIHSVTNTSPGELPVITFSVTDPTNSDAPYDILADDPFTDIDSRNSSLSLIVGWDTSDYTNFDSGDGDPGQPFSINALSEGVATDNGDGTFTVTSTVAVPSDATGSGVVAIQGHPAVDGERVPVTNVVKYFSITDSSPVARREVVDIDNCNKCHESLSMHGSNRTDEIQVCVICHNPNATDVPYRTSGAEVPIDFKNMIHAIHAADMRENDLIITGYRGSSNDFSEVAFPGTLQNCQTCHLSGTYEVPLDEDVLATTVNSGADLEDPLDDLNITPTASVCSSCHDGGVAISHMESMGAEFEFTEAPPEAFIFANGESSDLTISSADSFSIEIMLNSGSEFGKNSDWWVAYISSSGEIFWFDLTNGIISQDVVAFNQGPLFDLFKFEVYDSDGIALPSGTYIFVFGVDTIMNGVIDGDVLYYDSVVVTVTD